MDNKTLYRLCTVQQRLRLASDRYLHSATLRCTFKIGQRNHEMYLQHSYQRLVLARPLVGVNYVCLHSHFQVKSRRYQTYLPRSRHIERCGIDDRRLKIAYLRDRQALRMIECDGRLACCSRLGFHQRPIAYCICAR